MSQGSNRSDPPASGRRGGAASSGAGAKASGKQEPNPAQAAFGKYRARLAGQPMGMPPWGTSAGWPPMPPSAMMAGAYPQTMPHPLGSLSHRLGSTLRLSVDLLNATLVSAAHALGGYGSLQRPGYGCGEGCGCHDGCRNHHDCCREMGVACCYPGVHGCGCDCCCGCR